MKAFVDTRVFGGARACPRLARVAASLALAGLTGCALGPSVTRSDGQLPSRWQAKDEPAVTTAPLTDDQWWKSLEEPTLDRLIDLAAAQNLPLQAAGLRIVEARAQGEIARARRFPQLQVIAGEFAAVGFPQQVADYTRLGRNALRYEVAFDAAWEIDLWGKYQQRVNATEASTRASVADYEASFVSLSAEVARAYVSVRTSEALIAQAWENVRLQEASLGIAQSRFENGATSELDPTQAQGLLESTRARIPPLEFELQAARNALSILLGQPPGAVDALLTATGALPTVPPSVAVGEPADLVRRRPDVRRAEELAAAQGALVGVARAELYPSVVITGEVGLRAWSEGQASHNLFSSDAFNYSAGPRVVWPFLNYGRLTNAVRVEDARFQQLVVAYRDTVLRAVQEVEDAIVRFQRAQEALASQQRAALAAERSVKLSMIQYREGAVDFQRVLDSQRSLVEEQDAVVRASASVVTGLIALYKALGGGGTAVQGRPVVPAPVRAEMEDRTSWGDLLSQPRAAEKPASSPGGK